jgi:hypothetical protein
VAEAQGKLIGEWLWGKRITVVGEYDTLKGARLGGRRIIVVEA